MAALLVPVALASCVTTDAGELTAAPESLNDTEVVAVSQPGFRLPPAATLAWGGDLKFYSDHPIPQLEQLSRDVRQGLELALAERGFNLVQRDAAIVVFATVIIGDADDDVLMGVLRQRGDTATAGGATLGMVLRRPGSERNLWQAVIRFEPGDIGQPQQLLARTLVAADVLLQRLPGS